MAIKANLLIDQGTTFKATIDVTDTDGNAFDLTNYTVASQMRKNFNSSSAVTFSTSHDGVYGKIDLMLTNTATESLAPGRYLYDVEITSQAGEVTRVVEGIVTVTPGMTRI